MTRFFTILLLFVYTVSSAQTRLSQEEKIGWAAFYCNSPAKGKVNLLAEYQFRRVDYGESWQQSLLRLGVNYKVNAQITTQLGFAWVLTYPYGEYSLSPVSKTYPEYRIHEQVVVTSAIGKATLTNRLRLEQRWVGKFQTVNSEHPDTWTYLNRVRHLMRIDIPVSKKVYTGVFNEIFIDFGKNVGENVFDQNRASLFVGYKFNNRWKLEGGLFNQTLELGREINNKNLFQYNNGFLIASFFQL